MSDCDFDDEEFADAQVRSMCAWMAESDPEKWRKLNEGFKECIGIMPMRPPTAQTYNLNPDGDKNE